MKRATFQALAATSLLVTLAWPAHAQQNRELWPRWSIDAGAYQLTTDQTMRVDGRAQNLPGTEIDWSRDLLPDSETLWTLDGEWEFAAGHAVGLRYQKSSREETRSIQRQIQIGDNLFPIGARVSAKTDVTSIDSSYTYWWVRQASFGFGPSAGLLYLQVDAEASARLQAGSGGQSVERRASESTDLPIPMFGVAMKGTPTRRLLLYAEGRYLPSITLGDYTGQASTYSLGAEYFVYGPFALGLSYDATAYKVDLDKTSWKGKLRMNTDGFRLFVHAGF